MTDCPHRVRLLFTVVVGFSVAACAGDETKKSSPDVDAGTGDGSVGAGEAGAQGGTGAQGGSGAAAGAGAAGAGGAGAGGAGGVGGATAGTGGGGVGGAPNTLTIDVQPDDGALLPDWIGFHDGAQWVSVPVPSSGVVTREVQSAGEWELLVVCAQAFDPGATYIAGTLTELSEVAVLCPDADTVSTHVLSGQVNGPALDYMQVWYGGTFSTPHAGVGWAYSSDLPAGIYDVVAFHSEMGTVTGSLLFRGVDLTSGDQVVDIDVSTALAPGQASVSLLNPQGNEFASAYYWTERGTAFSIQTGSFPLQYPLPAAAQVTAQDRVVVSVRRSGDTLLRVVEPADAAALELELSGSLSAATATVASSLAEGAVLSWADVSGAGAYAIDFEDQDYAMNWRVIVTAARRDSGAFTSANVTSVAGWQSGWGLPSSTIGSLPATAVSVSGFAGEATPPLRDALLLLQLRAPNQSFGQLAPLAKGDYRLLERYATLN